MWHTVFVLVLIWLRRRTCVSPASRCLFYQEKNSEQALVNGYPVRLRTKWRLQLWTVQIYVATGISTCSKHESSTLIYSHWIFIWFPACRHHSSTLEYVSIRVMPPVLVTSIDTSHLKMIENEVPRSMHELYNHHCSYLLATSVGFSKCRGGDFPCHQPGLSYLWTKKALTYSHI